MKDYLLLECQSGTRLEDAISAATALCKEFVVKAVLFVHNARLVQVTREGSKIFDLPKSLEEPPCNGDVGVVRKLMEEIFTLVFSTLAWAEAYGVPLSEANRKLEQAVCEKYGLGHEVILGLVAGEALHWVE